MENRLARDYAQRLGIVVETHEGWQCLCPNCTDHTGHFYFNSGKGLGYCVKCGYGKGLRFGGLLRDAGMEGVGTLLPAPVRPRTPPSPARNAAAEVVSCLGELGTVARAYLLERGLQEGDLDFLKDHLHVQQMLPFRDSYWATAYRDRIIFPVYSDGKTRAFHPEAFCHFVGRYPGLHDKPYLNAPRRSFTPRGQLVAGLECALCEHAAGAGRAVICEGVFDALAVTLTPGFGLGLATLGKVITDEQIRLIEEGLPAGWEVWYAPDADVRGAFARATMRRLITRFPDMVLVRPNSKDLGELLRLPSQDRATRVRVLGLAADNVRSMRL